MIGNGGFKIYDGKDQFNFRFTIFEIDIAIFITIERNSKPNQNES